MSDCILWEGATKNEGYGYVKRGGKNIFAHRLAYQAANGTIPEGMVVRHTCDTPSCINPEHLVLGTQADNINDMYERKRDRHATGEAHGRAKLTVDDVNFIRTNYKRYSKKWNLITLGAKFSVDPSTVKDALNYVTWK